MNTALNTALLSTLVLNEARLRLRRLSSVVAVLAVIALAWVMIPDPQTGVTLMAIDDARVLYTSSTLAYGSSALASLLFGLAGFYLVRGRIAEDMRSGCGGVIAATQVGNGIFLLGRWLGGVVYLLALLAALLGAMLVCHLLRGEGSIELFVYIQTYAAILLPMVFFAVSCAILFDSFAPLMGKLGDLIFFFIWMAQIAMMNKVESGIVGQINPFVYIDFIGAATSMANLKIHMGTNHFSIGTATFNAAIPPILLPNVMWSDKLLLIRGASALLALLPLLPAIALFHRFSPDRVQVSQTRQRRSPLIVLNQWLRPFAGLAQALFRLAQALPGLAGQICADLALTVASNPLAGLALLVLPFFAMFCESGSLPGLLTISVAMWGILVSDIASRDHHAALGEMTGALNGGIRQRYLRQFAATAILGLLLTGVIALRWSIHEPVRSLALLTGIFSMSAVASLLGRLSRTPRTFLSLFLFGLYVAVNAVKVPVIDIFGFNGVANSQSISWQVMLGLCTLIAGYFYNRRAAA
ncbi:hypothetical protein [Undibacterium umbellatum]|uniref:ABC transporter permease n=1 Tax=Undibacterium umbellatum TaxID=2762300 RepID=A0ABR6ZEI0_9BURK|nr:hypothetical protein [Undibacterium umbellatum]MBC3910144.1 hypothetical protein [Undibacterium umbellatum]